MALMGSLRLTHPTPLETNTTVNSYSCPFYHNLVGRGYFVDESIASRKTCMVCVHLT